MSIWSSVSVSDTDPISVGRIPLRDKYGTTVGGEGSIDVATATFFTDLIRLSMMGDGGWVELLVTTDEAHRLIQQLKGAIQRINHSKENA